MAKQFYHPKYKPFVDYYPVEGCLKPWREKWRCRCGHLEMRPKLLHYDAGFIFFEAVIECEQCGRRIAKFW